MKLLQTLSAAALLTASIGLAAPAAAPSIAPKVTLETSAGKPVLLSSYRGKVVVLNFFSVWFAPCREEMPWLQAIADKYQTRGVVVVGAVEETQGWQRITPILQKYKISYPVMLDREDSFTRFKVDGLPSTVIVDRAGKVRYTHEGKISQDEIDRTVAGLV